MDELGELQAQLVGAFSILHGIILRAGKDISKSDFKVNGGVGVPKQAFCSYYVALHSP